MNQNEPNSLENTRWVEITFTTDIKRYASLFPTRKPLHRILFYSFKKIGGVTNRKFFGEHFNEIYFRQNLIKEEKIELQFFFLPVKDENLNSIIRHITLRLKNLVFKDMNIFIHPSESVIVRRFPEFFKRKINYNKR